MKKFFIKDWEAFMQAISGMNIQTLEDSYDAPLFNIVNIRHDVDDDLHASFMMAQQEHLAGIRATYFMLDTAEYWHTKDLKKYVQLIDRHHHNIGWHNNAISNHLSTHKPLIDCIKEPLSKLREVFPVIGTASHGDPLCHQHRYLNYYIFKNSKLHQDFPNSMYDRFDLAEFGLKYEAYHVKNTHYLSDAGGHWNHEPIEYIEQFKREGGKLIINIHPQWWQL